MPQAPGLAGPTQEATSAQIGQLRAKVNELTLRASDLGFRERQIHEQRENAPPAARPKFDKQWADVQHDLAAVGIQIGATTQQIHDLEMARDMGRAFSLQQPPAPPAPIALTAPPAPDPFLRPGDIMGILGGGAILVFPLILVLARRLWVRGVPRTTLDIENSPRLQRIEQAIESIAVEVERIGEAQRFTTKLLSDRQPDAVARLSASSRKEPGTITPH